MAGVRGLHVLAVAAIILGGLALRATEVYTAQYQSLPVLDWLESRPPLVESAQLPAASDLVRGLPRVMPQLQMQDDVRTLLPIFGPPGAVQRTVGGVRDAARISLGSLGATPAPSRTIPVQVRLDAIVFNRTSRAAAWSELMSSEEVMDFRDPESGLFQVRLAGPDERDGVWLSAPRERVSIATVAGYRGPVAFELQVTCQRVGTRSAADEQDLSARAETIARQAARDWTSWLEAQLAATAA